MELEKTDRIVLIGAGRMGSALAGGWIKAGFGGKIQVIDPKVSPLVQGWADAGKVSLDEAVLEAKLVVVAVKPQFFGGLAPQIAERIGPQTQVLSIMAGIPLAALKAALGTENVARAMPNTPGLIGKGVTILSLPETASPSVVRDLRALLEPLGAVEGPISEDLLPAATAVSGSGPAYGFLLTEVMAKAGAANGLDPDMAMRLARLTVEGAGALMQASREDAATLRKNVTSPGGVTQAALDVLMAEDAIAPLFEKAVAAAIARDHALAEESQ
ncbi:MAG: pyrroline-5-carboxylate reductase [Pseudomonadota bacterium]